MAEIIQNNYIPTPTQYTAHVATQRYKLFGGAMGGGKSRWLCEEAKELSMQYPGNRGLMGRYHLSDFKNTTLKTLLECFPEKLIRVHNQAEHTIGLINGSEILYVGFSEEENVSKIKSMELGWFAIDEASEVEREHFLLLQSRLRRRLPNGKFPPYYGIMATNPADCWLKDDFVLNGGGIDYLFIPSLPKDNPYLPADYTEQLRKTYPSDWVNRYLEGSWDELSGGDKVIPSDWIRMAIGREIPIEDKIIVASDIARFGDDEIVIYVGNGGKIIAQDITQKKSTMETAGNILALKNKHRAKIAVIDDIGVGGGVTDRLREMGCRVIALNCGAQANLSDIYSNLKTEMWWHAREMFKAGIVSIPNDPILIRQLGAVRYMYRSNGKIMIEPKDDLKRRIGQSPDRADALIMMLWGTKFIRGEANDFKRTNRAKFFKDNKNSYGWSYHTNYPYEVVHA